MILPYLELPLIVGYGQETDKVVKLKIQPNTITAYHQGYYEDLATYIYVGDQPFQIAMSLDQFEFQIKQYWDLLNGVKEAKNKIIH